MFVAPSKDVVVRVFVAPSKDVVIRVIVIPPEALFDAVRFRTGL